MMPWSVSAAGSLLRSWFRDYERIQGAAVVLLYLQVGDPPRLLLSALFLIPRVHAFVSICRRFVGLDVALELSVCFVAWLLALRVRVHSRGRFRWRWNSDCGIGCALVGSLGALYNGLLLIHLIVALFALIAIESNSQNLGRTYAALLACGILLDVMWFIFFSHEIWNMSSEKYGHLFVFSLRLTLWMQIIGFSVRILSSLLWIQMYRMGVSSMMQSSAYMEADFVARNFLNPSPNDIVRQNSNSNFISGGSSPFEDAQENAYLSEDDRRFSPHSVSASTAQPSELMP